MHAAYEYYVLRTDASERRPCIQDVLQKNSTQLNFIVTRLQLNSWIAKYSSIT